MKGKTLYFTQKEIEELLKVLNEWEDLLGVEGEEKYAHHLHNGLGTAWGKLTDANKKKQIN